MKNKGVISQLDSIEKFSNFSKFNSSYDKVFAGKTLKSLLNILAHPTYYHKRNFLDELSKKFPYEEDQFYRTQQIVSLVNTPKVEKNQEYMKIYTINKNDNTEKLHTFSNYSIKSMLAAQKILKQRKEWVPDFLLYNPKYKSVDKNIPSVKICNHIYKDDIIKKNNIDETTKHKKSKRANLSICSF